MSIVKGLDRGVLLDVAGPQILTSYVFSAPQKYGGSKLSLWAKLTADAAAALTGYTLTLQVRYDPSDPNAWQPVQSRNQITDGGLVTAREHAVAIAQGATLYRLITCDQAFGAVEYRVGVKADAAGVGNDRAQLSVTTGI